MLDRAAVERLLRIADDVADHPGAAANTGKLADGGRLRRRGRLEFDQGHARSGPDLATLNLDDKENRSPWWL